MKPSLATVATATPASRVTSWLTTAALVFSAQWGMAQLYSNGVNNISSNWIGISKSSPEGSLHIKETAGSQGFGLPGQPPSYTFIPLLRLEGTPAAGGPIPVGPAPRWDMRMDGLSSLTFWTNPSGTDTPVLTLNPTRTEFKTKIMFGTDAEFDKSITPDGTQGYHLSLGMREISSGNWMGTGFAFHQTSNGDFHLVLNKTANTVIQGQSGLADITKLSINSYKATFNVHQEISTRPSATGNSNYADLEFTNAQSANSDKRMFVIRSIGEQHSSAPNTLEFWDPNNNGNAWFAMPVRIGGNFADLSVINNYYNLYVANGIRTEKVNVLYYNQWPDYVFEPQYQLTPLAEVEEFVEEHKHLPGVPSASEVKVDGVDLGEMNAILLKKIEELTLYVIDLEQRINEIQAK